MNALWSSEPSCDANRSDGFVKLLDLSISWSNFRVNESDITARIREREVLSALLSNAGIHWSSYIEAINEKFGKGFDTQPREELLKELLQVAQLFILNDASERLSKECGVSALIPYEASPDTKLVMFDANGPLWTPIGNSLAEQILAHSNANSAVQRNALDFLVLIQCVLRGEAARVSKASAVTLIKSAPICKAIWQAATARPLQFRKLADLRKLRDELIEAGANPDCLAVPEWLTIATDSLG